jgi:hypothetical protein
MNIFLDENLPERVANSLNALEGAKSHFNVYHTGTYFGCGIKDVDLIQKIKAATGVLITQDDRIRTNAAEIGLIKKEGVSVLIIGVSAQSKFEKFYQFIFSHWEKIKSNVRKAKKHHLSQKYLPTVTSKFMVNISWF